MNNLLAQGAVSRNQAQAAQRELQEASIRLHTAAQAGTQMQPASPQSLDEQKKTYRAIAYTTSGSTF